ncbi:polysaccharide biosynthesis protein, partial [Escherichia coli]
MPIIYTGLRPGEKLHETLFYSDKDYRSTAHPKILEAGVRTFA